MNERQAAKREAYYNGFDDAMNNFLADAYGQRELVYSGDCGYPAEYTKGFDAGWVEAQRIDDMVE